MPELPEKVKEIEMSNKIVVVGSSNVDLIIKGDKIPARGETVLGGTFYKAAGGKGATRLLLHPGLLEKSLSFHVLEMNMVMSLLRDFEEMGSMWIM